MYGGISTILPELYGGSLRLNGTQESNEVDGKIIFGQTEKTASRQIRDIAFSFRFVRADTRTSRVEFSYLNYERE